MNLTKWDQATCEGCQVQLADKSFNMQSRLKSASPTEAIIQWKCPNCCERNETVFTYEGDINTSE